MSPQEKHCRGASLLPSLLKNLVKVLALIRRSNFNISLGTSWLASFRMCTRQPAISLFFLVKKLCATPSFPARPVRPILWT